jgi:hypothetical protein
MTRVHDHVVFGLRNLGRCGVVHFLSQSANPDGWFQLTL